MVCDLEAFTSVIHQASAEIFVCGVFELAADTATVSISANSSLATTEEGGTAVFAVVLDSQPSANVTIAVFSSDTGEGVVSVSSLMFGTDDWNSYQTVTVTGVSDVVVDGNVAYNITTGVVNSSDTKFDGVSVADVTGVTNMDGLSNQVRKCHPVSIVYLRG